MKLEGTLSISYPRGNRDGDFVSVRILDSASGARFVELEISYHEFTAALSSLSDRPCMMDVRGLDCLGKRREVKTVSFQVSVRRGDDRSEEYKRFIKMVEAEETEGWIADIESALRTQQPAGATNVTFRRWVEASP